MLDTCLPITGFWIQNAAVGAFSGKLVHFLDLLCWMFGGAPSEVVCDPRAVADPVNECVCTLVFPRGCSATLVYSARGSARTSKESIEVLGGGHTWTLDDFRCTRRDGEVRAKGKQNKGHEGALRHFVRAALGQTPLRVTAADGLRATRLALELQGRSAILGEACLRARIRRNQPNRLPASRAIPGATRRSQYVRWGVTETTCIPSSRLRTSATVNA